MTRATDILLTALAPAIWGSTYLVTTEMLPAGYPLTLAVLRGLPAGLLLLLIVRRLPQGIWWAKVAILGALNFSIFWWLLFEAAYRLPGGVAATAGAIQPLVVLMLARGILGTPLKMVAVLAALAGLGGVALLVLAPGAALNGWGVAASLAGAVSMAFGTVLTRKWQAPVSPLAFTAWQLIAGSLLLVPAALWFEPALPALTRTNLAGFVYLGLIGAAATYALWFRGIARLDPATVAPLGLLSPVVAVILGFAILGQNLTITQGAGIAIVLVSVWAAQRAQRTGAGAAPVRGRSHDSAAVPAIFGPEGSRTTRE